MKQRPVICHYHIYKNAGTSFDRILRENFGDRHVSFDSPIPHFQINQEQLAEIVGRNSEIVSLSSHQIHLPTPATLNFRPISVVFLRHPLLRIRSIFRFERKAGQESNANEQSEVSAADFEDWLRSFELSANSQNILSNDQTNHLCRPNMDGPRSEFKHDRWVHNIDQAISNLSQTHCIGRTEHFDQDIATFIPILEEFGLTFEAPTGISENTYSRDFTQPIETQLEMMKTQISAEAWDNLLYFNHQDLELYDYASTLIARRQSDGYRPYLSENI